MSVRSGPWKLWERDQLRELAADGHPDTVIAQSMNRPRSEVRNMARALNIKVHAVGIAQKAPPKQAVRRNADPAPRGPVSLDHERSLHDQHRRRDEAYVAMLLAAGGFCYAEIRDGLRVHVWPGGRVTA